MLDGAKQGPARFPLPGASFMASCSVRLAGAGEFYMQIEVLCGLFKECRPAGWLHDFTRYKLQWAKSCLWVYIEDVLSGRSSVSAERS